MNDRNDTIEYLKYLRDRAVISGSTITEPSDCITRLCDEVLELLKDQEPRVLTLGEVEDSLDTIVWVDRPQIMNSSSEFALLASYSRKHEKMDLCFIDSEITTWRYSDYGKTWRCWSAKPTDEQREAVPWTE